MGVEIGKLSDIGLSVLLDKLSRTGKTGFLKLYKDDECASIEVYKGCVVDCLFYNSVGPNALIAAIVYQFDMYSFICDDRISLKPPIARNIESLFIKAYLLIDEISHLKKYNGLVIAKSNGYIPLNNFEKKVCNFIEKPVPFDEAVDTFILDIYMFVEFIKKLNASKDVLWLNKKSH